MVPFRNGIMLSIAVGVAESNGLKYVMMANHGGDHTIYPDCRPEFVDAFDQAAAAGTYVFNTDGELVAELLDTYAVTTLKNGYEVKAPTGEITYFYHNANDNSWSMEQNGVTKELFQFNADGKTIRTTINNQTKDLTLDEAGVYQARMMANDGTFFAMN